MYSIFIIKRDPTLTKKFSDSEKILMGLRYRDYCNMYFINRNLSEETEKNGKKYVYLFKSTPPLS